MRGRFVLSTALLLLLSALPLSGCSLQGRSVERTASEVVSGPITAEPPGEPKAVPETVPNGVAEPTGPRPWPKATALQASIAAAMADFTGEYSVVVQDLRSGERFAQNAEHPYHPASTIKLPVALYTLEQHRAGKIGWDDLIEYTPADFESPGGGAFEGAPFGGLYPIKNLVNRSLIYSNNVAVNMLGRYFGWQQIEAWTKTIDGDLNRVNGSPQTTALGELGWWLHLDQLAQTDPASAALLLDPLGKVAYDGRIAAGLPAGTPHLHKFGSYDGNYHDGGIIYTEQPYILIVMTHGGAEYEADEAIAAVSAAVYRVMTAANA